VRITCVVRIALGKSDGGYLHMSTEGNLSLLLLEIISASERAALRRKLKQNSRTGGRHKQSGCLAAYSSVRSTIVPHECTGFAKNGHINRVVLYVDGSDVPYRNTNDQAADRAERILQHAQNGPIIMLVSAELAELPR